MACGECLIHSFFGIFSGLLCFLRLFVQYELWIHHSLGSENLRLASCVLRLALGAASGSKVVNQASFVRSLVDQLWSIALVPCVPSVFLIVPALS